MSAESRRLVAFTALGAFASFHWFGLIDGFDASRWIATVAITAAGGGALLALRGRAFARAGAVAVAFGTFAAGLLAIGIPAALIAPGGWSELAGELHRGLAGVSQVETPYPGPDRWTALGILAAIPLAVSVGMTCAFWPAAHGRSGRAFGLVVFLFLYGSAVTWQEPSGELVRGAGLFVAIAAVLWLPRVQLSRAATAAAAVSLAGVAALPLAARVDASDPVIAYTQWHPFGAETRVAFNWNPTYGALDWPQDGTEVFQVKSDEPLYWKTYVLDDFSGGRWRRERDGFGATGSEYDLAGASADLAGAHPKWVHSFDVTIEALQSRLAVTSGSRAVVGGIQTSDVSGDGTVTALDLEIPSSTEYSVDSYVPDPGARKLRRVDAPYPRGAARYTTLEIPQPLNRAERLINSTAPVGYTAVPPQGVDFSRAERRRAPHGRSIDSIVAGTPYDRVLRLARRLTAGARTDYAAVARIQRFLLANYTYNQDVPLTRDPLLSFLFHDRAGYCQQFSGAMALMLRMVGIPSRVASGFAPGSPQADGTYAVRDTDAHSWVEVLFPGIGWVTVDPTPSESPAHTAAVIPGSERGGTALVQALGKAFDPRGAPRGGLRGTRQGANAEVATDRGSPLPALIVLAAIAVCMALYVRRRRRLRSSAGADPQLRELERALALIGRAPLPGATLLRIQRELSAKLGPDAGRYASALRESRYGRKRRGRPGPAERRSFRWALIRRSGPAGWWRALRAIPPGGPSP